MPQIPDHYVGDDFENSSQEATDEAFDLATDRYFTASEDDRVVALRNAIVDLAVHLDTLVPPGRNKSLALTALEDVQMRANRGIFAPEHLR
jgi:hypothetical protein